MLVLPRLPPIMASRSDIPQTQHESHSYISPPKRSPYATRPKKPSKTAAELSENPSRVAKKAHPTDESAQKALVNSVFENITTTTDPVQAVKGADLVVEAIVENLRIK